MNIKHINTIRELKEAGYKPKTIKEEIRQNLIKKLQSKEDTFNGIIGYEDTVIPMWSGRC
jgi:magnesium chelatase subunit I